MGKRIEVDISGIPKRKQKIYELAAELTKYRLTHETSQRDLAKEIGYSRITFARFENTGRYPNTRFLNDIAKFLKIDWSI